MALRRFILLGDKTSHGGTVIGARGAGRVPFYIDGRPVACVGDPVICPRCRGVHRILTGADDPPVWLDGALVAVENGKVSDGAALMSIQQFHAFYGDDGVSAAAAYQRAVAEMAKNTTTVERAVAAKSWQADTMAETSEAAFGPSDARYAERFQLTDEETGEIVSNTAYCIEVDGKKLTGKTDAEGFTRWVNLSEQSQVAIHWGREAERRARQQG